MAKKVLLMIIDALSPRVFGPGVASRDLPNFAALIGRGTMATDCCSIFPSITPAATASLATGGYPSQHGIAGAHWYDANNGEVAYYGSDLWVILNEGLADFFQDFLVDLNFTRLRRKTVFQMVEAHQLAAACINSLWFHGNHEHEVNVPWLMSILPGIPKTESIQGPEILYLGDFVTTTPRDPQSDVLSGSGGIWRRFGFHDESTAAVLLKLARNRDLPPFTLAYFPENDFASHRDGPHQAFPVLTLLGYIPGIIHAIYIIVTR